MRRTSRCKSGADRRHSRFVRRGCGSSREPEPARRLPLAGAQAGADGANWTSRLSSAPDSRLRRGLRALAGSPKALGFQRAEGLQARGDLRAPPRVDELKLPTDAAGNLSAAGGASRGGDRLHTPKALRTSERLPDQVLLESYSTSATAAACLSAPNVCHGQPAAASPPPEPRGPRSDRVLLSRLSSLGDLIRQSGELPALSRHRRLS